MQNYYDPYMNNMDISCQELEKILEDMDKKLN